MLSMPWTCFLFSFHKALVQFSHRSHLDGWAWHNSAVKCIFLLLFSPPVSASEPEPETETEPEAEQETEAEPEQGTETPKEIEATEVGPESEVEQGPEREPEESAILSEKERQNEEVNEKDNCSASSISSASSTLEREEREDKLTSDNETGKVKFFQ